jgi:hypothetical protein
VAQTGARSNQHVILRHMAFLCTFTGMLLAGMIWMALFIGLSDASNRFLVFAEEWLSPEAISGWLFYLCLCVGCSLLTYRLLRPRREHGR